MSGIVLSSAVRANLTTLQSTTASQGVIQNRLATGKKVNSALDNPSSFFTASGLSRRANDLAGLLDSMQQGVKTLEAADNAMKAITKNIESMQANIRQARQDRSFKATSFTMDAALTTGVTNNAGAKSITISGGSVAAPVTIDATSARGTLTGAAAGTIDFNEAADNISFSLSFNGSPTTTAVLVEQGTNANTLKVTVGGTAVDNIAVASRSAVTNTELASALTTAFAQRETGVSVAVVGGAHVFTATSAKAGATSTAAVSMTNFAFANGGGGAAIAAAQFGFTAGGVGVTAGGTAAVTGVTADVDAAAARINENVLLKDKVKATNDGGKLRIENLSTTDLTVVGATAAGVMNGGTGGSNTHTIAGNEVRKNLISQFNELRVQLDRLANDASYSGVNLVKADKMKITFNETGTSTLEIQAKDANGTVRGIDTSTLGLGAADAAEYSSDATLDARLEKLSAALTTVQTQSGSFGAALTTVQNRQDFTKSMINTLQTGSDSLVLADANEEAAKLLALNTRQQISQSALSLASQGDQAVLGLLR